RVGGDELEPCVAAVITSGVLVHEVDAGVPTTVNAIQHGLGYAHDYDVRHVLFRNVDDEARSAAQVEQAVGTRCGGQSAETPINLGHVLGLEVRLWSVVLIRHARLRGDISVDH